MKSEIVARDERTTTVENAGYRWAYLLLSYGLLLSVAYRAFVGRESNWDLLGLVVLSGLVTTFYQAANRVLSRQWAVLTIATVLLAAASAIGIAWLR